MSGGGGRIYGLRDARHLPPHPPGHSLPPPCRPAQSPCRPWAWPSLRAPAVARRGLWAFGASLPVRLRLASAWGWLATPADERRTGARGSVRSDTRGGCVQGWTAAGRIRDPTLATGTPSRRIASTHPKGRPVGPVCGATRRPSPTTARRRGTPGPSCLGACRQDPTHTRRPSPAGVVAGSAGLPSKRRPVTTKSCAEKPTRAKDGTPAVRQTQSLPGVAQVGKAGKRPPPYKQVCETR